MKKIILSFSLLCLCLVAEAQTDQLNHSKYWFYRHRLLNDFVATGEANCGTSSGYSIPAGGAYEGSNPLSDGNRLNDVSSTSIHFGDGTSHLGYYIGVLATEHKILREHGATQSQLDRTAQELYWAMKAYERLDRNAEVLLAPRSVTDCNTSLNGFFMRDDVDSSIVLKMKRKYQVCGDLTKPKLRTMISDYESTKGYTSVSAFVGSTASATPFNSQDQIGDLFVGFALVRKLMAGYNYNGYDFSEGARIYTQAIMDKLAANNYQIKLEGDGGVVKFGGTEVQVDSYALAKAGQRITHNSWGKQTIPYGDWENALTFTTLSDVWSRLNYPEGLALYEHSWNNVEYNNAIISELAAIGNSWDMGFTPAKIVSAKILLPWPNCTTRSACHNTCVFGACHNFCISLPDQCSPAYANVEVWCYTNTLTKLFSDAALASTVLASELAITTSTLGMGAGVRLGSVVGGALPLALAVVPDVDLCAPFPLPKLTVNTTALALSEYGWKYNNQIFPLLHKVLHNQGNYTYSPSSYAGIINSAPCTGPHAHPIDDPYNTSNDPGAYGWNVDNRFEKANFANYPNQQGGWPGLDYMLFYNLWMLEHGNYDKTIIGNYIDEMNIVIDNKINDSGSETVKGYSTIESIHTTIKPSAHVTYLASDFISLKPGFSAQQGSTLGLLIKPTTTPCDVNTSSYYGGRVAHDPSTSISKENSALLTKNIVDNLTTDLKSYQAQVAQTKNLYAYKPANDFIKGNTETSQSYFISAYPNPATSELTVELNLPLTTTIEFTVKNSLGEMITDPVNETAEAGVYNKTLDVSQLKTGLYFLSCKVGGETTVKKFFKQ